MKIILANAVHIIYSELISKLIDESAKTRGTGIARRSPVYIKEKILSGNSIIAVNKNEFVGFCYIEVWGHGKYVAHSGLIVSPNYRKKGIGKLIKKKVLQLSLKKYPNSKIFGITTCLFILCIIIVQSTLPLTADTKWEFFLMSQNFWLIGQSGRIGCEVFPVKLTIITHFSAYFLLNKGWNICRQLFV